MTFYILYNPKANQNSGEKSAKSAAAFLTGGDIRYQDVTDLQATTELINGLAPDDVLVLCGGDGTLNHFVNDFNVETLENELLYYACGTGNDFLNDIEKSKNSAPFPVKQYLTHLPTVTVKGKTYRFFNDIGYGIDGYCCEVGDRLRATTTKPINYTSIAIKGLLFHYRPTNAVVIADGKEMTFSRVWIAPTMNGRFFGGGMMAAPDQNRLENDTLSTVIMHGAGRLRTLMMFPSIFKGEHVQYTNNVHVYKVKEVTVRFDRPTALQIDGETILGVTEYTVRAPQNKKIEYASAAVAAENA